MQQAKISFEDDHIKFLNKYEELGFKDKSSMVRLAVEEFKKNIEKRKLIKSARLYSEIYKQDSESKEWINSSIEEWPE